MSDVTRILSQVESGDLLAAERLLPLIYDELRKLASAKLSHERPGQTFQATALVHEAYLRLVDSQQSEPTWQGRGHFFAAVAEAMRRILIEKARRKARLRHGGDRKRVDLDHVQITLDDAATEHIVELDAALARFAQFHPHKAELVKLRYFAGLTADQAASALGISPATGDRYWTYARAWLFRELSGP